jgi:antitoxin (DNA-binding transcriptional repressor) of toxin-antitoxin stability system
LNQIPPLLDLGRHPYFAVARHASTSQNPIIMKSEITATEASRRFSELLNRLRYRNESFVVKRGGELICEIIPAGHRRVTGKELVGLINALPRPDQEYLDLTENLIRDQPLVSKSPWDR